MGIVSKEINGILYEAEYSVADGIVTVYGDSGHKSTQLGGMKEESLAKILLSHLIREDKVDPTQ
ncbi:MAG TPA: hypothetical protein VIF10_04050 [Methylobacter sp.]|jgi:hypothetical protein